MAKKTTGTKKTNSLGLGQLLLWQSRPVSMTVSVLLSTFLMIYCTDTLQMSAALVSMLLIASKFIDGITDMLAGFIVDNTKTKWGKGRPYEVFIVALWLTTWLLFSCSPDFSMFAKGAWVFTMYTLVNAVCTTFLNANNAAYTVRAFNDQDTYVKISSFGGVITMLVAIAFNVAFPMAMGTMATTAEGWSRLIGIIAVPMAAIGILRMLFIEEKYDIDAETGAEKVRLKDVNTVLKNNKYILLIALMNVIFSFVANMGVAVYYFTYIVKNVGLMGVIGMTQIIIVPLAFTFPKLIAKYTTGKIITIGFVISAFGFLINFFAGTNLPMLIVGSILSGGGTVPASMLSALLIIDCAEFNEWKGLPRLEGTISSIFGFAGKVGGAIGAASVGFLLEVANYTGTVATMPNEAFSMIRSLYSLIPMALYLLTAIAMNFYRLDKLMPQIRQENEEKRSSVDLEGKQLSFE